jgi:hypothetical protein
MGAIKGRVKATDVEPVGDEEAFRDPESSMWSPYGDPGVPPAMLAKYGRLHDVYYAAIGRARAAKGQDRPAAEAEAKSALNKRHAAFEACRAASKKYRAAKSKAKDASDVRPVGDALTTMTNFDYKRGRSKELDAALDAIKRLYEEREGLMEKVKEIERRITAANAVWRKLDRDFEKNK